MKKTIKYLIMLASLAALMQSCKKSFLDRPPIDQLTTGNFYTTDEQVLAGTAPLYNIVWFDYNDKAFMAFGEARGGNLNSNDRTAYIHHAASATDVSTLLPGYKSFYKIIAQSNLTMQGISTNAGSGVSDVIRKMGLGECHFMRAMAYYYLVNNWGAVPIIYDNISQLNEAPRRNNIDDVWKFIVMDLRFAADNLPSAPQAQGRLTKWSAEGMLSRVYLTISGLNSGDSRNQSYLDSAKYLAGDVIHNSGLKLDPDYADLFKSASNNSSNNNPESLFSLQWMPFSTPWGVNNSFQAYVAFESNLTKTGDGWGAAQGVSADVVRYFMDHPEDSIRRKATCMFNGDYYPDLEQADGGLHYGVTSISNIKKYVIGSPADNGGKGAFMSAYINTYILRLAEVYLIYSESILGNSAATTDPEALQYFNAVRARAGLSPESSITFSDIFQEKRVETIMEGNAWNEIVRWYYFDPAAATAYTAQQDKGNYTINYVSGTSEPRQYTVVYTPEYYPVTPQTLYLPFPEAELINAPSLTEPPVPFDFSKLN